MTVTRKLILLLLIAAILPLAASAWLVWRSAREALTTAEVARLSAEARSSARDVAHLADRARTDLQALANHAGVRDLLVHAASDSVAELPEVGPAFEFVVLYDAMGQAIATSPMAPLEDASEALSRDALAALQSWTERDGKEATHFVCAKRSRDLNVPACGRNFCMGFMHAVTGPAPGWLYASVCWSRLIASLDDRSRQALAGSAEDLAIRFAILSESPPSIINASEDEQVDVQAILPSFEPWLKTGQTQGQALWNSEEVALGLAPIRLASDRPADRWWIAMARPLDASAAALEMLRKEFLGVLIAAVLIAACLAAFVGRSASGRLRHLAARAVQLGSSARPETVRTSRDEIVSLGLAFDRLEEDLEQKRAQLRAVTERLADLVRSTPDPLLTVDLVGRVQHLNPAAEAMLGSSLKTLRTQSIWERLPQAHGEIGWREAFENARSAGSLTHFEVTHHTADAERIGTHYDVAMAPVRDLAGKIVRVMAILRDQTARTEAQSALANQHVVLNALYALRTHGSEAERSAFPRAARLLVEQLGAAFAGACVEEEGRIAWLGSAMDSEASSASLPATNMEEIRAWLAAQGIHTVLERPLVDRRGERRGSVLLGRSQPEFTRPGDPELLELFARWTIVELEVERLQRAALQQEKMVTVGGLAAGMAHEINNPLASVLQNLQLLSFALDPNDRVSAQRFLDCGVSASSVAALAEYRERFVAKYLERIEQAGTRAAKIVGDLLTFSRNGKLSLQRASASEIIRRAVELAAVERSPAQVAEGISIDLQWTVEPEAEFIVCNARQMEQVLLNLIQNAAHALRDPFSAHAKSAAGARITVQARAKGIDRVVITVSDNGPGIKVQPSERVFEPFFTTKEVGEGTGLGLYVAWFLVTESNGGEIRVQSRPGEGTQFEIELRSGTVSGTPAHALPGRDELPRR